MIPKDDNKAIIEIIDALVDECKKREIAITGGETSIHNNMSGLEISITASGIVENEKPNMFEIGDVLLGVRSSGLHSNGFTKVREAFGNEFRPEFIEPTAIYIDDILELDRQVDIHGMMHITGGAYTKLRDALPKNADAMLSNDHKLKPQPIFYELYRKGISDEEMYKTFNCGIGFVLSVASQNAGKIISKLDADIIGRIVPGRGKIKVKSMFSDKRLVI